MVCLSMIVKPQKGGGTRSILFLCSVHHSALWNIISSADVSFMPVAVFFMACCRSKSWVYEVHRAFFFFYLFIFF